MSSFLLVLHSFEGANAGGIAHDASGDPVCTPSDTRGGNPSGHQIVPVRMPWYRISQSCGFSYAAPRPDEMSFISRRLARVPLRMAATASIHFCMDASKWASKFWFTFLLSIGFIESHRAQQLASRCPVGFSAGPFFWLTITASVRFRRCPSSESRLVLVRNMQVHDGQGPRWDACQRCFRESWPVDHPALSIPSWTPRSGFPCTSDGASIRVT
jgi:hypothetical protein